MNSRIGKTKFDSLIIILDSGARFSIVICKDTYKLRDKNTQIVRWSTQCGDFQTNYTTNIEFILPELVATKSVTWNFEVD